MLNLVNQNIFHYGFKTDQYPQDENRHHGANKTGINVIIFHFNNCGKLSIIRCDKILFQYYKQFSTNMEIKINTSVFSTLI